MGLVPRRRTSIMPDHYGRPQDAFYVDQGLVESLLLSMPHRRLRNGAWSGGGPFYQVTDILLHTGKRSFPGYNRIIWRDPTDAVGVAGTPAKLVVPSLASYSSNWSSHQATSWSYAASGYRKTRPGNPTASLGQFLVELRDLPKIPIVGARKGLIDVLKAGISPSRAVRQLGRRNVSYSSILRQGFSLSRMMHEARGIAREMLSLENLLRKNPGGEYLNYVFGWKPFIDDLRGIYNLWGNVDKQLAQIVKDNGKGIRRGATLSSDKSVTSSVSRSYNYPGANVLGFPGDYTWGGGKTSYTNETVTTTTVWYSAKYRYWIPDVSSSQWTKKARAALFGALPTPSLVWELVPFSWLIDWAVNVEDVVSNMSANAVDNLTQEYSYIMRSIETTTTSTAFCTWYPTTLYPGGSGTWQSTRRQTVKTRTGGGSPFALSAVAGTPLTTRQLSIAAALGYNLAS